MAKFVQKNYNEYDAEPVSYCSQCFSLKVRHEDITDSDCCMECGCSDIATSTIDEWEDLYQKRYGHKYVTETRNVNNSPIFKLSISELKKKVYELPIWDKIVHSLYPRFPGGLGKKDSLILLFDKLVKDNRMNELRMLMFNYRRK